MKKILAFVLIIFSTTYAISQGCHSDILLKNTTIGGVPAIAAGSGLVNVCLETDKAVPCTTMSVVLLYSDSALTKPISNPVSTDNKGNYSWCAASGTYNQQPTGSGLITKTSGPITISTNQASLDAAPHNFTNNVTTNGTLTTNGAVTNNGTVINNGVTTVPTPVNATDASRKDYTDTPAPFAGLANALSSGNSTAMMCGPGDSTGNEISEWCYLFTQYLATRYPAYTVRYWPWDDTITDYDPPTIIQTGTAGAPRTVNFNGSTNGVRLAAEDIPTFTVGGAIDLRTCRNMSSWRPASSVFLLNKFVSPYRTLRWSIQSAGTMLLELSTDGTAVSSTTSSVAITDTGANTSQCMRVTWVPGSPSNVTYYTGTDNVNWTQLGTVQVTATATINQSNNGIYDVGVDDWTIGGNGETGKVTSVELHNGVNGPILNPRNIDAWQILDTATYSGAPEFNVLNAAMPGAGLAYWQTLPRQSFALTNFQQVVTMVSLSHNEARSTGTGELQNYGKLFASIDTATPTTHLIVLTQNPRTAPATFINEHAIRRSQLMSWTGSPVGYDVIDTYRAFINDPRWATTPGVLVCASDGIHPSNGTNCTGNAGELLWATTIEAAFQRSLTAQSPIYTGSSSLPAFLSSPTGTGSVVLSNAPHITGSALIDTITSITRTLNNAADADLSDTIQCGLTVAKNCWTTYRDFNNTAIWQEGKTSSNSKRLFDVAAGVNRYDFVPNGSSNFALPTGASFQIGGGPLRGFSTTAFSTQVWQITLTGQGLFNAGVSPNGNINQMITVGTGAPTGCTTAKGGSVFLRTDGTTTTTLYVCDGSTGVWTAK